MECSVTGEIDPPYIIGLDGSEYYNLMRSWFKHDGLLDHFKENYDAKKEKEGYFFRDNLNDSDFEISEAQASIIITFFEDKIRADLYEHVEKLEECQEEMKYFMEGVTYAIRNLNFKPRSIFKDER